MINVDLQNYVALANLKASNNFVGATLNFTKSLNDQIGGQTIFNAKFEIHYDSPDGDDYLCASIPFYTCLKPDWTAGHSLNFVLPYQCNANTTVNKLRLKIFLSFSAGHEVVSNSLIFDVYIPIEEKNTDFISNQLKTWGSVETLAPVTFSSSPPLPYPNAQITNISYDSNTGMAFTVNLGKGQTDRAYFWVAFWFDYGESYCSVALPIPTTSSEVAVVLPMPKAPPANTYPMFSLLFGDHPPTDYTFSNRTSLQ